MDSCGCKLELAQLNSVEYVSTEAWFSDSSAAIGFQQFGTGIHGIRRTAVARANTDIISLCGSRIK